MKPVLAGESFLTYEDITPRLCKEPLAQFWQGHIVPYGTQLIPILITRSLVRYAHDLQIPVMGDNAKRTWYLGHGSTWSAERWWPQGESLLPENAVFVLLPERVTYDGKYGKGMMIGFITNRHAIIPNKL